MSGIAARLGGSKGTLWNYFPSKEELFAAVLQEATDSYQQQLAQILDPEGPLEDVLHHITHSLVEKVTSEAAIALHRMVIADGRRFPELSRIFHDLAPRNTLSLLSEFLAGAMRRGQLRRADPTDAARLLMGLGCAGCHRQLLMAQIERVSPDDIASDARLAADTFLRAYSPHWNSESDRAAAQ